MHHSFYYANLTEKELAADEYFQQWVLRPDEGTDRFWNEFADLYPECLDTVRYARRLVEELAYAAYDITPLSSAEKQDLKQQIYSQLQLGQEQSSQERNFRPRRVVFMRRMAAAAVVVGVAVGAWFLYFRQAIGNGGEQPVLMAERTGPNEVKKILLSDSTLVILNANSTLRFKPDFSVTHNREVTVEGNAFFRVRKDAGNTPFVVKTNSLSVTVLGTEFNVNARTASPEVSLATGKIKLTSSGKDDSPVYLLPGDKVRLDTATHTFSKTLIDASLYSAWTDGVWNFKHNTLEEITNLIGDYYGVSVVYQSQRSKHMRINAFIAVGSLQKLVPVLAQTFHTKMSLEDNRLVIQ